MDELTKYINLFDHEPEVKNFIDSFCGGVFGCLYEYTKQDDEICQNIVAIEMAMKSVFNTFIETKEDLHKTIFEYGADKSKITFPMVEHFIFAIFAGYTKEDKDLIRKSAKELDCGDASMTTHTRFILLYLTIAYSISWKLRHHDQDYVEYMKTQLTNAYTNDIEDYTKEGWVEKDHKTFTHKFKNVINFLDSQEEKRSSPLTSDSPLSRVIKKIIIIMTHKNPMEYNPELSFDDKTDDMVAIATGYAKGLRVGYLELSKDFKITGYNKTIQKIIHMIKTIISTQ